MSGVGIKVTEGIRRRVRAADYLCVAQLFLKDNFLLKRDLTVDDIKPRLLGHWGTCHGINVAYANLKAHYYGDKNFSFVLGPGHGFPALQANLFLDGELEMVDPQATRDEAGIRYIGRNFSWPDGFPSHASPYTPGVITEGGELGYATANAYGVALGHPEKTIAVLIGDGESETATGLDSLNLNNLLGGKANGTIVPLLHLNGYKISAPSIYARKSERELNELIRGFGFTPIPVDGDDPDDFQMALNTSAEKPFFVMKTEKGEGGPTRHQDAHQIPLKHPREDENELRELERWLKSYKFEELFDEEEGFKLTPEQEVTELETEEDDVMSEIRAEEVREQKLVDKIFSVLGTKEEK